MRPASLLSLPSCVAVGAAALIVLGSAAACSKDVASGPATPLAVSDGGDSAAASPSAAAAEEAEQEVVIPLPADLEGTRKSATKTSTGLATAVLRAGNGGPTATSFDVVALRYTGWTADGKVFDTAGTDADAPPLPMRLDSAMAGLSQGVQMMVVGEKRRLFIPAALGYDEQATKDGAPAGDLIVDVELADIVPTPLPPPAPSDSAAPPATAKKTASGIAYRILVAGPPKAARASASSVVVFNYSAWTPAGKLVASSFPEARPASEELGALDRSWTEALRTMRVGEKARFWLPESKSAARASMTGVPVKGSEHLVVDIELLYLYELPDPTHKK